MTPRSQCPIGIPASPSGHSASLPTTSTTLLHSTPATPHSLLVAAAVTPQYRKKTNSNLNDRTETPQHQSKSPQTAESPGNMLGSSATDRSKHSPVLELDQYDRLFIRAQQEALRTLPAGSAAVATYQATPKIPPKSVVIQTINDHLFNKHLFVKSVGTVVTPTAIGPVDKEVSEATFPLQQLARRPHVPSIHEDPNASSATQWLKPLQNREKAHHEKITKEVVNQSLRGRQSSRDVQRSELHSNFSDFSESRSEKTAGTTMSGTAASGLTETTTKSVPSKKSATVKAA